MTYVLFQNKLLKKGDKGNTFSVFVFVTFFYLTY